MQRCGSRSTKICSTNAHKNAILSSSRNLCQGEGARAGTFAIIFDSGEQPKDVEPYCVSSTSAVDCTLSLGTPSTRSQSYSNRQCTPQLGTQHQQDHYYPLRWDFTSYEPKQTPPYAAAASAPTLGAGKASGLNWGEDPVLLARRCANCDTTSTPLWRNGPKGPKSLCNACGIRYKKEERRAASYAVTSPSTSLPSSLCTLPTATNLDPQQYERGYIYEHPSSYPAARQTVAGESTDSSPTLISSMYPKGEDDVMEVAALPSLSWWLNVQIPQRTMESYAPNILQDYTYT